MERDLASYLEFRESWLEEVTANHPTTIQLGQRFAQKIVSQWLDVDDGSLDITYCDGSGDGGIDIAVLGRGNNQSGDGDAEGDTWYLVQSKYGSAFAGTGTLLIEGQKVIDTLDGKRTNLSSLAEGLREKLSNFRKAASENDRIILTFATTDGLSEEEKRVLEDLRPS